MDLNSEDGRDLVLLCQINKLKDAEETNVSGGRGSSSGFSPAVEWKVMSSVSKNRRQTHCSPTAVDPAGGGMHLCDLVRGKKNAALWSLFL